jgi:hypothetical protein
VALLDRSAAELSEAELELRKEGALQETLAPMVAVETKDEGRTRERILRNTLASEGWYRKFARAKR